MSDEEMNVVIAYDGSEHSEYALECKSYDSWVLLRSEGKNAGLGT